MQYLRISGQKSPVYVSSVPQIRIICFNGCIIENSLQAIDMQISSELALDKIADHNIEDEPTFRSKEL
jgi:hypothetical protein